MVAALMRTYASDAATLCLAAIDAIKERATKAGEDPILSQNAKRAAYVAVWLWNVARRDHGDRLKCVQIRPVANPRADEWSRNFHLKYLAERAASAGPPVVEANSEVWTNLANALALQATDRSGTTTAPATSKRQGFDAFPVATQRLILVASEQEEDGQMRTKPVDTYVEVLELSNAAYVAQAAPPQPPTRGIRIGCAAADRFLLGNTNGGVHLSSQGQARGLQPVLLRA